MTHPKFMNKFFASVFILIFIFASQIELAGAGTLVCDVRTAASCDALPGIQIYRMSGATNAHAELGTRTTAVYNNNVVCCSGVTGLSNSCVSPQATALNLTAPGNSHASQTNTSPYTTPACISVPTGGTVSIGYQATNCTGFDTILGSISAAINAHVGNTTAYPTKICGMAVGGGVANKAATSTLTSSIFDTGITLGAGYNSIMWKGTLGTGSTGKVRFQFAASNCTNGATNAPTCSTGAWEYYGESGGTCGALAWFDTTGPDSVVELRCPAQFNNKRYFRYKVQLCSDDCVTAGPNTPTVTDIITSWAP